MKDLFGTNQGLLEENTRLKRRIQELEESGAERRNAEEDLRESEEKYRSLFDNSIDAILLTTPQGRILAANPEACRIFGRTEEEICRLGRDGLLDLTDPRLSAAVEERVRTGRFRGELTYIRKDGTLFPGEMSSAVFRDRDGNQKTSMIIRDITEKRKTEQNYRTLFREMLDGFAVHEILCDVQGQPVDYRFLTVNPAFERMTGLNAKEIIGRTVLEVFPNIEQKWITIYGRVALTGEPALFEDYSRALGKHFAVTAFQPVPHQFACIFADITDHKRAEEALQESEQKFKALSEESVAGIYLIQDGIFRYVNSRLAEILGYSTDEMIDKVTVEEIIFSEDQSLVRENMLKKLSGELASSNYEFRVITKNREIRDAEAYSSPIIYHGNPAIIGTCLDITRRKESETAIKKYSDDLRERVKELNCLYSISELVRRTDITQDEILQECASILSQAYLFPEIAGCRITWHDREYSTENFRQTAWSQSCVIMVHNKQVGTIEVCYLEERQNVHEGPFSAEERQLLNTIAELLGRSSERKQAEERQERLITELSEALSQVKALSGLLNICSSCKRIRNDKGTWEQMEVYIRDRSEAEFSHGICPECLAKLYPEYYDKK